MERGIHRQAIYKEEGDYYAFLAIMKSALEKYDCILHAYCIMTNHFHLLLGTGEVEISKFMKQLANCYAMYFNRKYGYKGHLFEGRYKAYLVESDSYFLQTSRYIHLNPVKAGIVAYPEDYRWSSYRTIIGLGDDKITQISRTHAFFGRDAAIRYREFIEDTGHKIMIQEKEIKRSMDSQ